MDSSLKIAVILTAFDKMSSIVNSAVSKSQSKLKNLSETADQFSKKAFSKGREMAAMGLASSAPLVGAVKQAMDFEKRMVDIRKQMNEDTPKFVKQMTDDVFKLGRELPIATGEIQDMIASSLRMGVAQDKVIGFTKDVTKMSVAFDMVPAEIADSMGKISNVFKIPIEQIGSFADAINYLDDNTMAKGPELIDVLQRIGGTSKYFDPKAAAALASTMLSLGESADTSGSGINAMINKLGAANMGSKKFQMGLQMLGLSANEVQKQMSDKATAQNTIIDVLSRINKLDPSKQNEVLVRLFGLEHGPKLAKLTNNVQEYERQLKLVQGQEKGSMNREYAKRIETAQAKWQLFKNRITEVAVTSGSTLLPTFTKLVDWVGRMTEKVSGFINKHPALIANVGKAVAVFSALSFAGSGLSFMFGGVAKAFSIGISVFTGVTKAITFVGNAFKILRFIMMANPVIAIVAAVAFAAYMIFKHWSKVKAFFMDLWEKVKNIFTPALNFIKGLFLNFTPAGLIIKHWDKLKNFFGALWDLVKAAFNLGVTAIKFLLLKFTPVGLIYRNWSKIAGFFSSLWSGIKSLFSAAVSFITKLFLNFTPIGLIIKNWDKVKEVFTSGLNWVMNLARRFYDAGANIINSIIDGITSKVKAVTDKIKSVAQNIRNHFPFSPAKEGPLRDIHRIKLVETIADGLRPNALVDKVRHIAQVSMAPFTRRVEMDNGGSSTRRGGEMQFNFNITLNGGATADQAKLVVAEAKKQFEQLMRNYNQNKDRVKY